MYKFTITLEKTHKVKTSSGYEFVINNSIPETRSFDLWEYREAKQKFDETCKHERENIQNMKKSNPLDFKNAGIVVELSFDNYDNNNLVDHIEHMEIYEYTCDDAQHDLARLC